MRVTSILAAVGALCVGQSYGQQYMGEVIPNSLPNVPGSEVAYFKIADPRGKSNKNLTLINYFSRAKDTSKRITESKIQRAVIFIHGLQRDPGTYMSNMLSALAQVKQDPKVNFDTVSIMAPYFPNGDDKNYGYPFNDGQKSGRGSNTSCLVWKSSQWSAGGDSQYPYYNDGVSAYSVVDQLIQYYDNATLYPNLNQVVIAGHSLGAQAVQRYAAIGKNLNTKIKVTYWIGNPDSYAWLSTDRPFSTASCADYDEYRAGYSNFTDYPMTYGVDLVAQGRSAIQANYQSKAIGYGRGLRDHGDNSDGCSSYTTGKDRNERFFEFIKAFPPSCSSPSASDCDTVDFVNVGHDAAGMMAAPAGQARLFLDNFYGNGNKSYDFGYPRQQAGDDPYPDPSLVNTPMPTNTNTYAGGMTYYGCWTDQSPATLTNLTYQGNKNTIELCTSRCASGGNTIAGLENDECFCGNALGYEATQVVESSCDSNCPGNKSETCGGYVRLSIFSNGKPKVRVAPSTPATIGSYNYLSCYTEASSGRALGSKQTSTNSMTLEYCANFCSGYKYFGTEYSSECYCGNSFGAGAKTTDSGDCSYTCAANATEFCGGSNRLTVYQNPNASGAPASSSVSASGSSPTSGSGPQTSSVSCPGSDGQTVTSYGQNFTIECNIDHQAGDLTSLSVNSFQQCIDTCSQNSKCVDVSLSGSACYLKSTLGKALNANGIWGAKLVSGSSTPSSGSVSSSTSAPTGSTNIVVSPSSSSSAPASTATTAAVSCPASDGQTVTSNGLNFLIECNIDHQAGDLKSVGVNNFQQCIDACSSNSQCVDVSLSGSACYLKSTLGKALTANGIWGAKLITSGSSSSAASTSSTAASSTSASNTAASTSATTAASSTLATVVSSSSSSSSAPAATVSAVSCPASNSTTVVSNGQSFLIECGIDHQGGDMKAGFQVNSLQQCIDACATTTGCVDLALSGSACYLKSKVGAPVYNGVYGAKLITSTSSSVAATPTA